MTHRDFIKWLSLTAFISPSLVTPGYAASDLSLQIQLIWGTNEEKPDDPKLKEIEPGIRTFLQKFKWKNYWEINRQSVAIAASKSRRVIVSKLCEVEVIHLDKQNFEFKLYGEKKLVAHRMKESLAGGRPLVLAGDDKNDSAWFVVISLPMTGNDVTKK